MNDTAYSLDAIGDAIISVLKNTPSIHKAVIFGSRAKGDHKFYSDIDIALYGDLDLFEVERIACDLDELPLIYTFDVVAYNLLENPALKAHIDRIGRVIYKK